MSTIDRILLLGLITWRVTTLITVEEGPFEIFARLRDFVGVEYDEFSNCVGKWVLPRALCCHWCASMWVGLITALVFQVPWYEGLAYSTMSIVIQKRIHHG